MAPARRRENVRQQQRIRSGAPRELSSQWQLYTQVQMNKRSAPQYTDVLPAAARSHTRFWIRGRPPVPAQNRLHDCSEKAWSVPADYPVPIKMSHNALRGQPRQAVHPDLPVHLTLEH